MIAAKVCAIVCTGQHALKTERSAFEAHKLQASTALKTDKDAFEVYQQQSATKLKVQSQVAVAREQRLSRAEKAVQARQTSLAAMEARLDQKALELAKGTLLYGKTQHASSRYHAQED